VLIIAERFRAEGRVAYERRLAGRRFETVKTDFKPENRVLFIAGDALEPPFMVGSFDMVAGLNILDNVHAPMTLLGQMDALLQSGGALLLGSPFEWREDITHPSEWLDTPDRDSATMLSDILKGISFPQTGFCYTLENEIPQLAWTMRNHDRYYSHFISHMAKARKPVR
jgi:SAM-dependent methyltransferase